MPGFMGAAGSTGMSGLGSWGSSMQGLGTLMGGIGSIYGGYQQGKMANKMFDLERTSYLDRKKVEDERRNSLSNFGSGMYGAM